jgi:hypothetical protein
MHWACVRGAAIAALGVLAMAACGGLEARTSIEPGIRVLAKADGWRADIADLNIGYYAIVEVAYDESSAAQAWQANRPDAPVERSGLPEQPGVYGDLAGVNFTAEAVVVFSSGQSGSCPGWLAGINADPSETVDLTTGEAMLDGNACTDDYDPYRLILAVDRELLPDPEQLPTTDVTIDGRTLGPDSIVTAYPLAAK